MTLFLIVLIVLRVIAIFMSKMEPVVKTTLKTRDATQVFRRQGS
jgi:hypothetical protein